MPTGVQNTLCEHPTMAVDKIRNMEHSGTCRNIPEHSGTCLLYTSDAADE